MIKISMSILLIMAVLIPSGGLQAAQKPRDVYGWENLKWGMTGDEIKAAFGKGVVVHKP